MSIAKQLEEKEKITLQNFCTWKYAKQKLFEVMLPIRHSGVRCYAKRYSARIPCPFWGVWKWPFCDSFPPIYLPNVLLKASIHHIRMAGVSGVNSLPPSSFQCFPLCSGGLFLWLKNLCFCCGLIEAVALGSDPGTMGPYTGAGEGSTLDSTSGQKIRSLKEIISAKSFQMCKVLFLFLLFSWMWWCHFISTQELVSTAPSMDHSLELQCHSVRSLCVWCFFVFVFKSKNNFFTSVTLPFPLISVLSWTLYWSHWVLTILSCVLWQAWLSLFALCCYFSIPSRNSSVSTFLDGSTIQLLFSLKFD